MVQEPAKGIQAVAYRWPLDLGWLYSMVLSALGLQQDVAQVIQMGIPELQNTWILLHKLLELFIIKNFIWKKLQ